MHVLITGSSGQLGKAVCAAFGRDHQVTAWTRAEADITRPAIRDQVADLAPDLVVNCAAWTQVDAAEAEPAAAFAANALGPAYLAEGCARCDAALVQFSTNEVFPGAPGRDYFEYDLPGPGSIYARSKLAGERAAGQRLARLFVVRVAWLFGPEGNHFPAKIIAAADKHGKLRVVDDELGNPTYAPDVAAALVDLVATERYGIYHLVNAGRTSRYAFAQAILQAAGRGDVEITPIPAVEWPRPAPPPLHAVLVNQAAAALGIRLRSWEDALVAYLAQEQARFARSRA